MGFPSIRALISGERKFAQSIKNITGFSPRNLAVFHLAFKHRGQSEETRNGIKLNNERLEYLGDAILGAIVADYLFKKFPTQEEGFLTKIRARLVSREHLNKMALKLGLDQFITFSDPSTKNKSVYGNALEALLGALFLDRGYEATARFYTTRIISHHVDMEQLLNTDLNYKSKLIEWSQKEKKSITFELLSDEPPEAGKLMKIRVLIDDQEMGIGNDYSKKKAEQMAAEIACLTLGLE